MFSTLRERLILGIYVFVLLSIPIGTYLAAQATNLKSRASQPVSLKTITKEPPSATETAKYLEMLSGGKAPSGTTGPKPSGTAGSTPEPQTTIATSFGPTLSLKVQIDGRPLSNQATKLFVGIIAGTNLRNPQYLLSFTVNLPSNGQFTNLSLAGLTVGSTYTAVLKGEAQIATSSAFIMNPAVSDLNGGKLLKMLSGDLNQDNIINQADLDIAQSQFGQTNSAADLNKDKIVNGLDLAIISKNLGAIGATGTWSSTPPSKTATPSGSIAQQDDPSLEPNPPTGSPTGSSGYWVWVPK